MGAGMRKRESTLVRRESTLTNRPNRVHLAIRQAEAELMIYRAQAQAKEKTPTEK